MSLLGNHAGFILAAYGIAVLVIVALFVWVVVDGRAQRRALAELEARGVRRRSRPTPEGGAS
jgi:heme exporter protein D